MPSPERPRRRSKETEPLPPYHRASRYPDEQPAAVAYFAARDVIHEDTENDLSVYRLQLGPAQTYHVAVLGESPPEKLAQKIEEILANGEPVVLPEEVLRLLTARRVQQSRRGSWVERHYRPGKRIP